MKARVDRARIYELSKAELANVPHALQKRVLDQVKYLFTLDRDKPVYGIVYDFIFVQDEWVGNGY